jgi:hypothetical protein
LYQRQGGMRNAHKIFAGNSKEQKSQNSRICVTLPSVPGENVAIMLDQLMIWLENIYKLLAMEKFKAEEKDKENIFHSL